MAIVLDANLGNVTDSDTLTTSAAAASNSRVIVAVYWFDSAADLNGGSGGGLTWVADGQYNLTEGGDHRIGFISADAPSGLASSTVITPSFDSSVAFGPGIAAVSFTGVATGASGYVDDVGDGRSDFNTSWETGNVTTAAANTLIIGMAVNGSARTSTPGGSWDEIHDWTVEGTSRATTAYGVSVGASTFTVNGDWSGSVAYSGMFAVSYKPAGATPTTYEETGALIAGTNLTGADEYVPAPRPLRVVQSGVRFR